MALYKLPFHSMEHRHPGLTAEVAAAYNQAARVCLDRHHTSPAEFSVQKESQPVLAMVEWDATDQRTRMAWANETDTTELGAYAMVLAALELTDGLVAVRRAETGSGADYYVGRPETGADDLEDCYQVSGTDRGSDRIIRGRMLDKIQQTAKGQSNLPAITEQVETCSSLDDANLASLTTFSTPSTLTLKDTSSGGKNSTAPAQLTMTPG